MKKYLTVLFSFMLLWSCNDSITPEDTSPNIAIDGATQYEFSSASEVFTVKVVSKSGWSYDLGGAGWISQTSRSDNSVIFKIEENKGTEERTAKILFKTTSGSDPVRDQASVSIKQKGAAASITIEPAGTLDVPAAGTSSSIVKVTANLGSWDFEVSGSPAWINAVKTDAGLSVNVMENDADIAREAAIEFFSPDKQNAKARATLKIHQEENVVHTYEDLSKNGTSNCYLIPGKGYYSFNATVRGNGKAVEGLATPAALTPAGAGLVWQTQSGMIDKVAYEDGKILFHVNEVFGNALLAALNDAGEIIWSWHLWFPRQMPEGLASATGETFMEYNVGALSADHTSVESYGMLYQWGRKDPFPGSPVMDNGNTTMKNVDVYDINGAVVKIGNTDSGGSAIPGSHLDYSISHPTICIGNRRTYASGYRDWLPESEANEALWGNPDGAAREEGEYPHDGAKTFYDPCPEGWRLPPMKSYTPFTKTGGLAWASGTEDNLVWGDLGGETTTSVVDYDGDGKYSVLDWTCGWHIYLDKEKDIRTYFPATTRYDGQYALFMGSMVGLWGNYWTNAPSGGDSGMAQAFSFGLKDYSYTYSITISPISSGSKADAYAVRCIKE